MAQYHFDMPEGWIGAPLPPPHIGVSLRPSAPQSPESRAEIHLLRPFVPPAGATLPATLAEALAEVVREGVAGARVIRQAEPIPFHSVAYPGLLTAVRLRLPTAADPGDEGRIFAVLDAGGERIPVVFAGGPEALPRHKEALDTVLTSLRPHVGGSDSPFSGWSG